MAANFPYIETEMLSKMEASVYQLATSRKIRKHGWYETDILLLDWLLDQG